jgi:cytochrome c553
MHCADPDDQVFSILPPFNVLHAQVIQKGNEPLTVPTIQKGGSGISVQYFSSANPNDPVAPNSINTTSHNLAKPFVYKSNLWDLNPNTGNEYAVDTYGTLYPLLCNGASLLLCYQQNALLTPDMGLPAPDPNTLPVGSATVLYQQFMPGISNPYTANQPQGFGRFDTDFNFFKNFPQFGQVVTGVNWFAADGVPITWTDDAGRVNAYPLMRVQANNAQGQTLAATDIVLPIASEADCQNCHLPAGTKISCDSKPAQYADGDGALGAGPSPAVDGVTQWVLPKNAPGTTCINQVQNAAKMNILLLHDSDNIQFTGKSLFNSRPIVCATCHYSPALDLTQAGPGLVNQGVNNNQPQAPYQVVSRSLSGAIHGFHATTGSFSTTDVNQNCYNCHPGRKTQCLRGVMSNPGGRTCFDCHGQLNQVGNDFTANFPSGGAPDFTRRVPWANVPKCQSCHTGDAVALNRPAGAVVAPDGIRLWQAYLSSDPNATPISSFTSRFAENLSDKKSNGNYGSILYRLSTGHGGVFCEGCHGSTHAEWPIAKSSANDNLSATQLQGHSGTVIECDTCHTGTLPVSLGGPHGIHPLGDRNRPGDNGYSQFWVVSHANFIKNNNNALQSCAACHGLQGQGTVLSVVAAQRTLRLMQIGTITLPTGTQVNCGLCHANPYPQTTASTP